MKRKFFIINRVVFILPLLIPLIILGFFSISLTQGYIRDDIDKSNIKILNQAKETCELIFNELDSLSVNFELNPTVIINLKKLLEKRFYQQEDIFTLDMIMSLVNSPVNSKPYIQSLYISYENSKNRFLVSNQGLVDLEGFIDRSWYNSFISSSYEANTWIETRNIKQFSIEKESTKFITVYKKLYSPGSSKPNGVIVMNIKRNYMDNILKGIISYPNQSVLILDEKNRIVSSTGDDLNINEGDIEKINSNPLNFFEFKIAKNSYMVSQIRSDRYSLKYVSIIPTNSLYKVPIQLVFITIILLVISFFLGLVMIYYITKRNYNYIKNIISIFESAEKGDKLPELPSRVKDEYGFILQNVIKTFLEQSYLKVQLSEKKYMLKAAEILALQSQINPHFLFNTLKTIFWKSIGLTGDQNEVSIMIEHLSNILHYSLRSSDKTVSLEEEISNTQSYIEIQKVRYKNKFGVIWQYDDAIVQNMAMILMLQPLIENCIYHGIKEKEGSSVIKIKFIAIKSQIKISIIDNGLGIDKDTLEKIRHKLSSEGDYTEHIGLINTNKRLKLIFGNEYGIRIRSKLGLGTVVYFEIPKCHRDGFFDN